MSAAAAFALLSGTTPATTIVSTDPATCDFGVIPAEATLKKLVKHLAENSDGKLLHAKAKKDKSDQHPAKNKPKDKDNCDVDESPGDSDSCIGKKSPCSSDLPRCRPDPCKSPCDTGIPPCDQPGGGAGIPEPRSIALLGVALAALTFHLRRSRLAG